MSEVLEFTHEEQSVVNVLTRGAWTNPISLKEIEHHLKAVDKQASIIILNFLKNKTPEDVQRILDWVISQWVNFTKEELMATLYKLPWSAILPQSFDK